MKYRQPRVHRTAPGTHGADHAGDVCTDFEATLAEFNDGSSHVHLLVHVPPKIALSRLVNSLKSVSSRRLRQQFPGPAASLPAGKPGCGPGPTSPAPSAARPLSILRQYIEQHNHPD